MKIKIITAQKKLFEGEAVEAILPGEDGEFAVLDHHQSCLYSLRSGQIRILLKSVAQEDDKIFTIRAGMAKVSDNMLTVMAETF